MNHLVAVFPYDSELFKAVTAHCCIMMGLPFEIEDLEFSTFLEPTAVSIVQCIFVRTQLGGCHAILYFDCEVLLSVMLFAFCCL